MTTKKGTFLAAALLAAIGLSGCGKAVAPGHIGIKVSQYGAHAGVDPTPLDVGWHGLGFGESLIQYPSYTSTYNWSQGGGDGTKANEEFSFNDSTALRITADVAITMHVDPAMAPKLYSKRRMSFDQLLNGPVRTTALNAVAINSEKMRVDEFYSGGREKVINAAMDALRKEWGPDGVVVDSLMWLGAPRYPDVITEALQAKAKADADTVAAQAQVQVATAQAQSKIEVAKGEAEANRLLAQSIAANPEVVQLKAIDKWNGVLPGVTGGAMPFVDVGKH